MSQQRHYQLYMDNWSSKKTERDKVPQVLEEIMAKIFPKLMKDMKS